MDLQALPKPQNAAGAPWISMERIWGPAYSSSCRTLAFVSLAAIAPRSSSRTSFGQRMAAAAEVEEEEEERRRDELVVEELLATLLQTLETVASAFRSSGSPTCCMTRAATLSSTSKVATT